MRKTSWRIAQGVAGALILFFLVRKFIAGWKDVQDQQIQWHFRPEYLVAALIVTWAMYGVLIWGWRAVLNGWRESLRIVDAARIWTISSLGSYIPGKVWAIAGMALMAQERGVSGAAATGSAVIMQLISIATGAILGLALIGTNVLDRAVGSSGSMLAIALALLALIGAIALTSPSLTRRVGFLLGRPDAVRPVDPGALAEALFANLAAWTGYGIALQLTAAGSLRGVELSWAEATGAFAASYIIGYLAIFLPGGLGVREAVLVLLVKNSIGLPNALALAAVSRIVLTINQVGAAVPFLIFRSRQRVTSKSG